MTTASAADLDIALHRQPLMREFTPVQFEQLMRIAEMVEFEPDEVIHREGDEANKLYLVVRGHDATELRVDGAPPPGERRLDDVIHGRR